MPTRNDNKSICVKLLNCLVLSCLLFVSTVISAQHPHFVVKDDESGLPSNEVYSIVQDSNGFLWLGSDAGLFRFNGVRYQRYNCRSQASKSITGLCFSKSGKLYCYNFKGQLFQVFGGKMLEIKHNFGNIQDITTDQNGNVVLNHHKGIALWNESTKRWKNYHKFGVRATYVHPSFTKSAKSTRAGIIFVTTEGLGQLRNGQLSIYRNQAFRNLQLGGMLMANSNARAWVFSTAEPVLFCFQDGALKQYKNAVLTALLKGRKITNVRFLSDGKLWICTYTGIITFDPKRQAAKLYFPTYSFSDVLRDKNGKFWFTTLHNGLLFVPDFNSTLWNSSASGLLSDKITNITGDEQSVYFSTGNGQLGAIDQRTGELAVFNTGNNADIQTLYADKQNQCLYFSQNNAIYSLSNGTVATVASGHPSVKKILHFGQFYCFASSNGLLLNYGEISPGFAIINRIWTRDLIWVETRKELWTATNEGIIVYRLKDKELKEKKRFLSGKQVLSLVFEPTLQRIYALTFDGKIMQFNPNGSSITFAHFNAEQQVNSLAMHNGKLFVSTSKGFYQYNVANERLHPAKEWKRYWTVSDGLASNIVSNLFVSDGKLWIAGGKGVQRFLVNDRREPPRGKIFVDQVMAGGKKVPSNAKIYLSQGEGLTLVPESNLVAEFGNFLFAYKFNASRQWSKISGTNEQLYIPSIPDGDFEIELTLEDNYGRKAANTIVIRGYMQPPFYRSMWFFVLVLLLVLFGGFAIYRVRILQLEKKQKGQMERLQLESDLRLTQQTALKAQMNPHFIFNVLNSIKSYIYKNDKAKAAAYLSDFSDLMRGILNLTNQQYVSLADELEFLKVYIELESMMLNEDFHFELKVDEELHLDEHEIPSLLLQPFVENAFKHGLHHKSGAKKLFIGILKAGDGIKIEIRDNGVGRERSGAINAERQAMHQSFATEATEKRIELINREGKMNVTFSIQDNPLEQTGTTVNLVIQSKSEWKR